MLTRRLVRSSISLLRCCLSLWVSGAASWGGGRSDWRGVTYGKLAVNDNTVGILLLTIECRWWSLLISTAIGSLLLLRTGIHCRTLCQMNRKSLGMLWLFWRRPQRLLLLSTPGHYLSKEISGSVTNGWRGLWLRLLAVGCTLRGLNRPACLHILLHLANAHIIAIGRQYMEFADELTALTNNAKRDTYSDFIELC